MRVSLLYIGAVILLVGCELEPGVPDRRSLPVRLDVVDRLAAETITGDLDGDGHDEFVHYDVGMEWRPLGMQAVWLFNSRRELIDQLNFQGQLLTPQFVDVDDDTMAELLVPFVRNDSLFVSVVDELGRKQYGFFLTAGAPRIEPNGVIPWDPAADFFAEDVDADGDHELIMHIHTPYARYPRGVAVYDLPDGVLLGHHFTGAMTHEALTGDFDGDGYLEIVLAGPATRNGAEAGGLSDDRAHILVYELAPAPRLVWIHEFEGRGAWPTIALTDAGGDGHKRLIGCSTSTNRPAQVLVFEAGTWREVRRRSIHEPLKSCQILDIDDDARLEVAFLRGHDQVWVLDDTARRVDTSLMPWDAANLRLVPDIDGDGIPQLAVRKAGTETRLLLGRDLAPTAQWDGRIFHRVRRGLGQPPLLLGTTSGSTYALEPVANRFYWAYRYGPWAVGGLAVLVLATAVAVGHRQVWKARLNDMLHRRLIDDEQEPWLVIDERGHLIDANAPAGRLLTRSSQLGPALVAASPLGRFVHDCLGRDPAQRCERDIDKLGQEGRGAHVIVEPLPLRRLARRLWLVRIDFEAARQRHSDVSVMLAQRVAHDIKNPLTSILLTLQRLQMEYQERAPSVVESLDPYTERIIDRIEQLRRMTRNFMKVVDQEEPSFRTLDPSRWLEAQAGAVRQALPPDIELAQQLEESPPPVRADPDQLDEALTNLVTNAVEAMPEGGTLTLSTGLAYGLLLPGAEAVHDYVVIEVMDTGVGLSDDDRDRIFEPGFTRFENGTGLGLALVRRIVDDHEGHIEVEGEPGVGSAFTIYLPASEPEPSQ